MEFIWDEEKRHKNLQKHGVDFADAVAVFFDDMALTFPDPDHHNEQRFITLGNVVNTKEYSDERSLRFY